MEIKTHCPSDVGRRETMSICKHNVTSVKIGKSERKHSTHSGEYFATTITITSEKCKLDIHLFGEVPLKED